MNCSITEKERISNNFFLLYLIEKTNDNGHFMGITKLQKLVYLIELKCYTIGFKSLSFPFFRWNYGPMSKELYIEKDRIIENGLIEKGDNIRVTKQGKHVLEECSEILHDNKESLEIINEISDLYSKLSTKELKNKIYQITDPSLGMKIKDIPMGWDLLLRLYEKKDIIHLDDEWIETIDIMMDTSVYSSVTKSIEDAQINKSIKCGELIAV